MRMTQVTSSPYQSDWVDEPIRVGVPLTSLDLGRGADLFLFALRPMPGTFQGVAVGATEFLRVVP